MRGHRSGLPVAVAIAVVTAGAATFLVRPRSGLIEPAPASEQAYFSQSELDRSRDYSGPQRALGLAGLAVTGGALGLIALRPPRRVRRALERAGARPILGAAAAGAGISVALVVVTLPLAAARHSRAEEFGLSTQTWGAWAGDVGKATGVEAVLAAGGAAILIGIMRRFPRNWWAPASAAVVALSVAFLWLAPVAIDPLFNKFTPLPEGKLRAEVLELAERSGVEVGEVYRIDASRRTTGANAYVGGLGHTKRVVLYDNLIEDFSPAEVRSVVAHELGHVKHDDVPMGLLWVAIVAPGALFLAQRLTERLAPEGLEGGRDGRAGPAALPAAALSLALVSFTLGVVGNHVSRRVEARADAYALRLTDDPEGFVALERRLVTQNLGDPDPPGALVALLATHPPAMERIGFALAYERERP
ncbi:MAG TPA: M48 family metallopeptidase [Thermoleophilaceae bacterium]|jgi:STE24 endopeptidase